MNRERAKLRPTNSLPDRATPTCIYICVHEPLELLISRNYVTFSDSDFYTQLKRIVYRVTVTLYSPFNSCFLCSLPKHEKYVKQNKDANNDGFKLNYYVP